MKKLFLVALVLILVGGLIPSGYTQQAPTPTPTVEKPQYGGILKPIMAGRIYPSRFGWPLHNKQVDYGFGQFFYEGLVVPQDQPLDPGPLLATSWELSPDKKSYTFHLRKGVKFHDGTDFNAQAVKYNYDLVLERDKTIFAKVTSVEVVDDYTIRINMSEFDALLLFDMTMGPAFIASPTAMKELGEEGMKTNPVGTGYFKLKSYKFGIKLEAEKFDDYWDPDLPYLDGLEYNWVKESLVAIAALEKGEANVLFRGNPKDAQSMREKGFKVIDYPRTVRTIAPDSANPDSVFSNKLVREAVSYALNRKAYAKALGYGIFQPSYQPASHNSYGYVPDLQKREYDPEKAKQLLTEAGYPNGFAITLISDAVPSQVALFEAIQADLAKVGIKAKLEPVDFMKMLNYRLKGGMPTSSLMSKHLTNRMEYALQVREEYLSTSVWLPELARPAGLDDLLDVPLSAANPDAKVKATQAVVKALYDDVTVIPVWEENWLFFIDPAVQNNLGCWLSDTLALYFKENWLKQ